MSKLNQFTTEARHALSCAREEAIQLRHRSLGPEHLLLGILKINDPIIEGIFSSLHVNTGNLRQSLEFVIGRGNKALLNSPSLNIAARAALNAAEQEAALAGAERIGIEHLLLGLLHDKGGITVGVLEGFGVHLDIVHQHVNTLLSNGREQATFTAQYRARHNETPTLNEISRDLTAAALAGSLDPLIGREVELERTMQILTRRTKNNPVLIGPAGVGKTAIAEGLAQRIIAGQVPEPLLNCRVVSLDVGLLTVGTKFRGDFEERLKRIMQEIINARGIIIVIDELHALLGAGVAEGSIDAANLFKPMLARGEFQCIGATTLDDYRKTIETDPALERRFQPVRVDETSPQETLEILRGLRSHYQDFHHVTITDAALLAAVEMSSRYIADRFQPDKAIDLIDEAAARISVLRSDVSPSIHELRQAMLAAEKAKEYAIAHRDYATASRQRATELQLFEKLREVEDQWTTSHQQHCPRIGDQQIAEIVAMRTGIPVAQIAAEEAERLLKLEDELHQRVIGQHEAVQAVAKAVRRSRTNLRDSRRPIGSFIFVGPTGVGKTELARALAATLFGDENALLKLDMSEFMESHNASRLIGAPPGYIGHEQAGQLTEAIRRRPYSVVLFDEIEKAHPKVFDLLLQILDDGCLTNSHGQTVNFKHTIIIITSNIGMAHFNAGEMAFSAEQQRKSQHLYDQERLRAQVLASIKEQFRPELLNRIDEIILFHPLEQEHLRQIVDLMIANTQQRLAVQSIELQVTEAALELLVEHGYAPAYGARPLRRTVQRMLDDMLAEAILQGALESGDTAIVDVLQDKLSMEILARDALIATKVGDERSDAG